MVCYVILHYKNLSDTVKCIESLQNTAAKDSVFILVDNGSGDGSGEQLRERYKNETRCVVLLLPQNVGFSKGNNEGYRYAKQHYAPDFIVVTNNDVVFFQPEWEARVQQIYVQTQFDVLGPDIYVPRHGDHQSPLFQNGITIPQLEYELQEYRQYRDNPLRFNRRLKLHAFKNRLCSKSRLINTVYARLRGKDVLDYRKRYENVGLQGACLIFSRPFIEREDKAFDPEPFLYEEEVFLFYRCRHKGYRMVYDPSISIRHEEAASFSNLQKNRVEKLRFMLEHHVKAREMLLDYLKSAENREDADGNNT